MLFENAAIPAEDAAKFFTSSMTTAIPSTEPAARNNYTKKTNGQHANYLDGSDKRNFYSFLLN